jgi:hypothetical protein
LKNKRHKGIYLSINGTLHVFPNQEILLNLGFSWGQIYHITNWKFSTLTNIGEPMSAEFCKRNQCKLGPLVPVGPNLV